jgi:uncharacterized damage-inducible protein DinB
MLNEVLIQLYERDLKKVRNEIEQYENEADLWKTADGISNSGGNLCLHITGGLQYLIGAVLGETGYVRDREAEFTEKNVSRDQLLARIDTTIDSVRSTLAKLTTADMEKPYPLDILGHPMTSEFFVTHLVGHVNYHLGQINYHRRILAGS